MPERLRLFIRLDDKPQKECTALSMPPGRGGRPQWLAAMTVRHALAARGLSRLLARPG